MLYTVNILVKVEQRCSRMHQIDLLVSPFMTDKTFAFQSGLPRTGSTLLSSILNQNPDIHAGPNSPLYGIMGHVVDGFMNTEQWSAYPKNEVLPNVITGLFHSYYSDRTEKLIIDKSRHWTLPKFYNLIGALGYQPKVIVLVRPILEILASFITLCHQNEGKKNFIDAEIEQAGGLFPGMNIDDARCDILMRYDSSLYASLVGARFAYQSGNKNTFHFVRYADLVTDTKNIIDGIYAFLGIDKYEHDFNNIENKFAESDEVYGLLGMHDIRPKISASRVNPEAVLSDYVLNKYGNSDFMK